MGSSSGARILIVEDNAELMAVLKELFLSHGYEVSEAQTGVQALVLLTGPAPDLPDVVLLDIGLPLENGVSVLSFIRRVMRSELPVVVLTASADEDQEKEINQFGVSQYLRKPASSERLLTAIAEALAVAGAG